MGPWVRGLLSEHPKEEVVRRVRQEIEESTTHREGFPSALARALVRLEGPERLRSAIERGELPRPSDPHLVATAVLRGESVTEEQARTLLDPEHVEVEVAATLRDETGYVAREDAAGHDVDLATLMRSPAFRLDRVVRERVDAANPAPRDRRAARRAERMTAYQSSVLRRGGLRVDDPRTGERASYRGFLSRDDILAMRLGRRDTTTADFYLLARGPAGKIRSLYLPDRDLLVDLDTDHFPIRPHWPALKMQLAKALLRHAGQHDAGRGGRGGRGRSPRITIRVGGAQNFAHVLWNYYGGLAREELLGNLARVRRVRHVGSEFFGPLTDIYPELESADLTNLQRAGRVAKHIDDPSRLVIPIGTNLLWPEALDRVAARARALRDDPTVAPLLERVGRFRVRLYVALRVRDKAWADAHEQLPRLIDRLCAAHPDACVLLDGFSLPSGADHVTERWDEQQRELHDLAATIRSRVREPDRVIDLIGLDLLRSIAVLSESTCFLCPVGTAHHKVDWFCDIPGVIYLSEQMCEEANVLPGHRLRRSSWEPRLAIGADLGADAVRIQRPGDSRGGLANFTLSGDRVWAELAPLVRPTGRLRPVLRRASTAAAAVVERLRSRAGVGSGQRR